MAKLSHQEKIRQIVEERGMYSLMNNTKWRELKKGVEKLPFSPSLVIKRIDEEPQLTCNLIEDVTYLGDWGYCLDNYLGGDMYAVPFYAVEWVKVRPRYLKGWSHRLVPDPREIAEDATEQFVEILQNHNIPYEEESGAFIIFGYKK